MRSSAVTGGLPVLGSTLTVGPVVGFCRPPGELVAGLVVRLGPPGHTPDGRTSGWPGLSVILLTLVADGTPSAAWSSSRVGSGSAVSAGGGGSGECAVSRPP